MGKIISTLSICFLLLGLAFSSTALANPSILPTDKSVIEAVASGSGQTTLKASGDLAGKFGWVEVYYKEKQQGGKYLLRFQLTGDSVTISSASVLGFNFGQGENNFLMIDENNGFPGKLIGLVQINGTQPGQGAKLGLTQ